MLEALRYLFLVSVFGRTVIVPSAPATVGPGIVTWQISKPVEPIEDTMQFFLSLGNTTEEMKRAVLHGDVSQLSVGVTRMEICEDRDRCRPMHFEGGFFGRDECGIWFRVRDVAHRRFVALRVATSRPLANVRGRLQNFAK